MSTNAPIGSPRDFAVRTMIIQRKLSVWITLAAVFLAAPGCTLLRRSPTPGRTTFATPSVVVPATTISNTLVVELNWDRHGPWRFLLDTGASVTLVSPEMASRYATEDPAMNTPQVRVRSASGDTTTLTAVTIRRITMGEVRFDRVPALVYDFTDLSAHFGVKIDGVLGFPFFRDTLLTLDYPLSRIVLAPANSVTSLRPGARIAFDTTTKTPLIPISVDDQTLVALVDSGSDGGLHLNPVGLDMQFKNGPRPGAIVATLAGDRTQQIGRLNATLRIGNYVLPQPVVDLTDELSSLGGSVLRNFVVTFDQRRGDVTFFRESTAPITTDPHQSAGVSFVKTPAYWRIVSVVPGSPAQTMGIQSGELVTRINGEPVSAWSLQRFDELVASAESIAFTFLNGRAESVKTVPTFPLVP